MQTNERTGRTKPQSDITLVCKAWRLGCRHRDTDAPIPVLSTEPLKAFYRAGRFGDAIGLNEQTSAAHRAAVQIVVVTED